MNEINYSDITKKQFNGHNLHRDKINRSGHIVYAFKEDYFATAVNYARKKLNKLTRECSELIFYSKICFLKDIFNRVSDTSRPVIIFSSVVCAIKLFTDVINEFS